MKNPNATKLAQQLLDWEFYDANHKPTDYCQAMGWHKDSKGTKKAVKKAGQLAPTAQDIEKLAQIISSIDSENAHEIKENNSVSDFLCNCVATHIQA